MTPEELDKLDALVKAATPGPWMLTGDSTLVNVTHTTRDVWTFPRTEADMVYLSGLLDAAPALIAAARDLAWHEDRHGTRAEQEAEDAVLDADLARIDALSDEECKAELAAEGIDYDAARKKLDVTLKLCAERADLKREVERLRAFVPVWRREDEHTLHLTVGPVALGGVMGPHPESGKWGAMVMDEEVPTEHPDLLTAARAVCARLGILDVGVPDV
jgi:hypothetical protein